MGKGRGRAAGVLTVKGNGGNGSPRPKAQETRVFPAWASRAACHSLTAWKCAAEAGLASGVACEGPSFSEVLVLWVSVCAYAVLAYGMLLCL